MIWVKTEFVQVLLGSSGTYLMLTLILLAVMSTGSGQVIAISSIIIYDIYQPYIQPFVGDASKQICELCEKSFRITMENAFKGLNLCYSSSLHQLYKKKYKSAKECLL